MWGEELSLAASGSGRPMRSRARNEVLSKARDLSYDVNAFDIERNLARVLRGLRHQGPSMVFAKANDPISNGNECGRMAFSESIDDEQASHLSRRLRRQKSSSGCFEVDDVDRIRSIAVRVARKALQQVLLPVANDDASNHSQAAIVLGIAFQQTDNEVCNIGGRDEAGRQRRRQNIKSNGNQRYIAKKMSPTLKRPGVSEEVPEI